MWHSLHMSLIGVLERAADWGQSHYPYRWYDWQCGVSRSGAPAPPSNIEGSRSHLLPDARKGEHVGRDLLLQRHPQHAVLRLCNSNTHCHNLASPPLSAITMQSMSALHARSDQPPTETHSRQIGALPPASLYTCMAHYELAPWWTLVNARHAIQSMRRYVYMHSFRYHDEGMIKIRKEGRPSLLSQHEGRFAGRPAGLQ